MYCVVILYAAERQITMLFIDGILSLKSKGFVEWQDFTGRCSELHCPNLCKNDVHLCTVCVTGNVDRLVGWVSGLLKSKRFY